MLGLMQEGPLDVSALMRRVGQLFGHKRIVTATMTGEVDTSWAHVVERARRLQGALQFLEVPRQARVATFAWNTYRHVELYMAVPAGGWILHTLNHRLYVDDLVYIANDAEDTAVFVDRSLLQKAWPVVERVPSIRWVVVMDDGAGDAIPDDPRIIEYEQLLAEASLPRCGLLVDEREAAGLCYTSGTTGHPKGVLYSHRSIAVHALLLLGTDSFAISERDVVMPIVPMFHANAWGLPYAAMLAGADLILPGPRMEPTELAGQLERHVVTFSAAVTTVWRSMTPLLTQATFSNLRMVISGGGAIPDELSRTWHDTTGLLLSNAWGMTETSPVVTCSRIARAHDDLDTEGRRTVLRSPGPALPFTEIRIVNEDSVVLEWDGTTPGELQVAGPTIASGYFGADDGSTSLTDDGWLRTGDVGTIDRCGYLRIVDRSKDLVKSGGEWISSVALEDAIMSHPAVYEAAVVGVPDDHWGERPLACVVLKEGMHVDAASIRSYLADRVAKWWIPDQVWIVPEIAKTSTGKVSKVALREMVASGTLRSTTGGKDA